MDTCGEAFQYCLGCLSHIEDVPSYTYKFHSEPLKAIFQVDTLSLCHMCKKFAQRSESFIQNVQSNQIYLENFKNTEASTIEYRHQPHPLVNLSTVSLVHIELTKENEDLEQNFSIIYSTQKNKDIEVKLEFKEEKALEYLDGEYIDDTDYHDTFIKGEDDYILDDLKEENTEMLENINLKQLRKTLRRSKLRRKAKDVITYQENGLKEKKDRIIKVVRITREQCMKERIKMQEDPKYKNCTYKCEYCIKGFNFKDTFEKHMESHSKVMGEYECDICKRRMNTMDKLLSHQKYHELRYKCGECGLTRINRLTIKDHYTAFHLQETFQYKCSQCTKMFKRQVSLRKHIAYAHKSKKRAKCKYCQKTYVNQESLKGHIMLKHSTDVPEHTFRNHICQECGAGFKAPSQLKYHMTKHSIRRDYYCVECDRGFKSDGALKQHLKRASPHVNYLEQPYCCKQCEKRFGVRRDLERHLNRVHLNIKPYQCDKCDRAYVNTWSLREHKRFTHEGHKRPLKYPCPLCDKVFAREATRKSHILTHTGERPYMCTKCPAQFSQASILGTHVKLVHLKLTRDGRPKKHVQLNNDLTT